MPFGVYEYQFAMSTKIVNPQHKPIRVLTIAGSDSGGSAGIQADLKTFMARGVFGCSALTIATAQDTLQVRTAHTLPDAFIAQQIDTVLADLGADGIKTGLLMRASIIELVAERVKDYPVLVVDPVLVNGAGDQIVSDEAVKAYQECLFPHATVITPNMDEAALLTGISIHSVEDLRTAAQRLKEQGPQMVVVKGGHLDDPEQVVDVVYDGENFTELTAPRLPISNPHGVGCTFASAIAAELAKGNDKAVQTAHHYLARALAGSLDWQLGSGRTGVNHGVDSETHPIA